MEVFRSLFRHKLRTVFTIVGIIVGIIALTVMGAMAEKLNLLVGDSINYLSGQITVSPKGGTGYLSSIPPKTVKKIKAIDGINQVQLKLMTTLESSAEMQMSMPKILEGIDMNSDFVNINDEEMDLQKGRYLKKGDDYKAVVGADIALDRNWDVGDKVKIRGKRFEVIGISTKNMTVTDMMVLIPLQNAQRIYVDGSDYLKDLEKRSKEAQDIPASTLKMMDDKTKKQINEAALFKVKDLGNMVSISWDKGRNPEKLVDKIEEEVEDISATSPKESEKQIGQAISIVNIIIFGSALIAVIVGGLSVINTMIMAVQERTREIGVKKALGAKTYHILFEYLSEAALLGLFGGLVGLGLGSLIVYIINAQTIANGIVIFTITTRLAVVAIVFSTLLGIIAGIYPAVHAARLNPVEALRYE